MDQELVFVCPWEEVEKDKLMKEFEKELADSTRVRTLGVTMPSAAAYYGRINAMISLSFSRGMTRLELNFSNPTAWSESRVLGPAVNQFVLPEDVYNHQGILEHLKLYWCDIDVPRLSDLGSLRSLSIGWVQLSMINLKKIMVSCPILESLSLESCQHEEALDIAPGSALKNLAVDKCVFRGIFSYTGRVCQFQLEFGDHHPVEALLDFQLQEDFVDSAPPLLCKLLEQLRSCRFMTICSVLLQIVPSREKKRTDPDLRIEHLTIVSTLMHPNEIRGLNFMMASCPGLEVLTLYIGEGKIFKNYVAPYPLSSNHIDESQRLLEINVRNFKGSRNEIAVISDIIRHGRCLRGVNLYISEEDELSDIIKEADAIRTLPRANPNLEITVSVMQMPMI